MEYLTLLLFERMGILLIVTFMITRTSQFRYFLDRGKGFGQGLLYSVFFGFVSIAGTYAGVTVGPDGFSSAFLTGALAGNEAMADSALIGIIVAGLLGGAWVGTGAGLLSGLHSAWMGGLTGLPDLFISPLVGLISGFIARFFAEERVIAPVKALFISVFPPIVAMGALLIVHESSADAIRIVDMIGVPMVIANSIGVGILVVMIQAAISEEERAAALETQRALHIAELVLPYLKQGLTYTTAGATADLLLRELRADAVAVTDTERILAYAGISPKHRVKGEPIQTYVSQIALLTGEIQVTRTKEQIQPHHPALGAAIVIPFRSGGKVAGLIKLYFQSMRQIRPVEEALARGLSKLISIQLDMAIAEQLRGHMKDAELKALQAQINPHFLFNTLNAIVTLIRIDPDTARRVTVKLGSYLRMNLTMMQSALVPLEQELEHLQAYLGILQIRFEEKLSVQLWCDPGLETVRIPPSTLQPLVENCIQHGFKGKTDTGKISIACKRMQQGVHIVITDNGSGFDERKLDQLGAMPLPSSGSTGLGLHNVNQRLIHLFGTGAGLRFANVPDGGARIEFTIPSPNPV
ncbi:LytS/YhcK type 5TM receptor domain-containing protein [Paenibacillus chartarius]|uniref:LytS/YhcK type 5TM receptor domain-containing protein n=1 Tax=Paenibacillus chartarius TaxID=747481 RepID=A0ABV6DLI5_9BACL